MIGARLVVIVHLRRYSSDRGVSLTRTLDPDEPVVHYRISAVSSTLGKRFHKRHIVPQMALLPRSRIVYKIWDMIADYLAAVLVEYATTAFEFLGMRCHFFQT